MRCFGHIYIKCCVSETLVLQDSEVLTEIHSTIYIDPGQYPKKFLKT